MIIVTLKWWDVNEIHREKIRNNAGSAPQAQVHSPWIETLVRGPLAPAFQGAHDLFLFHCGTQLSPDSLGQNIYFAFVSTLSPKLESWLWLRVWWICSLPENLSDVYGLHRVWNGAVCSTRRSKCPLVQLTNCRFLQDDPSKTESIILPLYLPSPPTSTS